MTDDETETRELFNTEAAQAYVGQQRHLEDVRRASASTRPVKEPEPQPSGG